MASSLLSPSTAPLSSTIDLPDFGFIGPSASSDLPRCSMKEKTSNEAFLPLPSSDTDKKIVECAGIVYEPLSIPACGLLTSRMYKVHLPTGWYVVMQYSKGNVESGFLVTNRDEIFADWDWFNYGTGKNEAMLRAQHIQKLGFRAYVDKDKIVWNIRTKRYEAKPKKKTKTPVKNQVRLNCSRMTCKACLLSVKRTQETICLDSFFSPEPMLGVHSCDSVPASRVEVFYCQE